MAKELLFEDISLDMEIPPSTYELRPEAVQRYLEAVEAESPYWRDTEEARAAFGGPVAPPTVAGIYARMTPVFQAYFQAHDPEMKLPPGLIHARQTFEFHAPHRAGDVLTTRARVVAKYERKGRKYVEVETVTQNQRGETVVVGKMTCIWPK